jgi:transposase
MENTNWEQIIAEKNAYIAELEALVKFLKEQLLLSKSRQFGKSSEKDDSSTQLSLLEEEDVTASNSTEPEIEQITYKRRKRVGKREDDLSALPVEIIEYKLTEEEQICPQCSGNLHEMGHDMRRELKIIPAQAKVVEHKRYVYSCRNCEKHDVSVPIVKAQVPKPLIKGSLASPSAVAHIMTQKYVMHAPLYRQEQDWKRQGVYLSRQTMTNWVIRCAEEWLLPLYVLMCSLLLGFEVLHADETTVQVLHEPGKAPTTKSYMWLYRTSGVAEEQIIIFEYQPSRAQIHPQEFLDGFSGLLHTDGYRVYHLLPPEITIIGCWVHLRRKFKDALKTIPAGQRPLSVAQEALKKIGYLFHLEDLWLDLQPEERHKLRLKQSMPKALELFVWLSTQAVLPQSATGKAINYALKQQPWLMNVYVDGRTELSNNRIENSVRPFALGRKNWLFCNTVKGAKASAIVYSIIETAKANGLKPFEYLEFLFETLPNSTTKSLESLLPWGDAVPQRCRMPIIKKGEQNAQTENRDGIHDGICWGVA